MNTKEIRKMGFHFGIGLLQAIGIFVLLSLALQQVINALDVGTDRTDKDGWNRSGMRLHLDHETGIEYLSAPGGGMMRRHYH